MDLPQPPPVTFNNFVPARAQSILLLIVGLLFGCGQHAGSADATKTNSALPPAIAELRALPIGDLYFSLSINGNVHDAAIPVRGETTSVTLDQGALLPGSNSVAVIFYYDSSAVSMHEFASGSQSLEYIDSNTQLVLSGIHYNYIDTDRDGIFDVHELAVPVADVDGDGRLNFNDIDSDNDGIDDGEDTTPWGSDSGVQSAALLAELDVLLPDQTSASLKVDTIIGGSGETRSLSLNNNVALDFQFAEGWPMSQIPANLADIRWTAFELNVDGAGLCDHFRLPLDVSSLQLVTNEAVLMYFKRFTGPATLTALNTASIENLDVFDHPAPQDGDGPLNDALRILLVPVHNVGWVDLWTDEGYGNDVCSINLGSPRSL